MRLAKVLLRTHRHYPRRVDGGMADIVMRFNMRKVYRVRNALNLVKLSQVIADSWMVGNAPDITFKVADINGIKAKKRGKKPSKLFLKSMMAASQWVVHDAIRKGLTSKHRREAKAAACEIANAIMNP